MEKEKLYPPKLSLHFFRWYCKPSLADSIEGDLLEVYKRRAKNGKWKADIRFTIDVLLLFRPGIIKPIEGYRNLNTYGMLKSYFKLSWRNLLRHRSFSLVNVVGLTLGITCSLFIYLIVTHELNYDRYHAKADRIFRINKGEQGNWDTGTPHGLAQTIRDEIPEVEDVGIVFRLNPESSNIEINHELFRETGTYLVQPEFFHLLDFQWRQGSPETSLSKPMQAVVAESIAEKYFRGEAIGKTLRLNNNSDFTVTGIIADPPLNSDFPIKIALSYSTFEKAWNRNLSTKLDAGTNSFSQTYVLLHEGVDPSLLESKLNTLVKDHVASDRQKFVNFSIQPLLDIHFNVGNFNQRLMSKESISTLMLIGLFILVAGCFNFINLSSSQSIKRAKEVGVRKTLGSSRSGLISQFLCETFLVTLASVLLSIIVTSQLITLSGSIFKIPMESSVLLSVKTFLFLGVILVAVTIVSGAYPAFLMSNLSAGNALKNRAVGPNSSGFSLRKSLIGFQFLISQLLIVSTIIAIRQTNFFLSMPLGFNKEAIVTFDLPRGDSSLLSSLRNNLMSHSEIVGVSFSLNTPSATINKWWGNIKHPFFNGEEKNAEIKFIDSTYLRLFQIPMIAGQMNLPDQSGEKVIVNESFVKEIGIDDPEKAIGERIQYWDTKANIIGVVKDFQTVSLREGMHPVLLTNTGYFAKGSVKIDMTHASDAITAIEQDWKKAFQGNYFNYAFLDDQLSTFYENEKKISTLLTTFTLVAIGIGCVGLFGLIAFAAAQRARELSIRKILGAATSQLAAILSRDFFTPILWSGLIAWPIAYFMLGKWLESFVNRIDLLANAWVFLASLAIAMLLALLTVGVQVIKAILQNPVEALRSE